MQVSSFKEQFKQRKIYQWEDANVQFVDDCPQQDNGYVSSPWALILIAVYIAIITIINLISRL